MDLSQTKLTKTEWNSIEIPVSSDEMVILNLIQDGYKNTNIRINTNQSMLSLVKIEDSPETHAYLYKTYFENEIKEIVDKSPQQYSSIIKISAAKSIIKKIDIMRLANMNSQIETQRPLIFEYVLIDLIQMALYQPPIKRTKISTNNYIPRFKPPVALYTLIQLRKSTIHRLNMHVIKLVDNIIKQKLQEGDADIISKMFYESKVLIEKNPYLLKYGDKTLFEHQKRIFQLYGTLESHRRVSNLVLYIAPTGTGKTLSPIGLACGYRVIFVCVARHVGLALAKSAISMEKKVAFAFGCETATDIRLHYFAAADYTKNKKSGGIGKVDNSVGHKVEIMICDVQSYLTAMLYMLAFNEESRIITYWDEPTMTMDYETHELHETIARNWRENRISRMVLSCATLPKESEIADTIMSFRNKFYDDERGVVPDVHSIISYDCKKSISILDKSMKCVLPHLLFRDFAELQQSVEHCIQNKSLLRYFDLGEIIRFIQFVESKEWIPDRYRVAAYFTAVADITMDNIKLYYLDVVKNIAEIHWTAIFDEMTRLQIPKYLEHSKQTKAIPFRKTQSVDSHFTAKSEVTNTVFTRTTSLCTISPDPPIPATNVINAMNISNTTVGTLITTTDAHTITDGPAIFLTEDPHKIGKFLLQQMNIPKKILDQLLERIESNNIIQRKIEFLEKSKQDKLGSDADKDKKMERNLLNDTYSPDIKRMTAQIEQLQQEIKHANIETCYVPNTTQHQYMWLQDEWREKNKDALKHAFMSGIDNQTVREIMELSVDTNMKLLLMIGIGVFAKLSSSSNGIADSTAVDTRYLEIMKRLAYEQKLFLIIASGDYIYGTNYQFAHGFLGKDLTSMTQQKTIQAMGRIGRGNIQQEYTIRFRDDSILRGLFLPQTTNMEAIVMSKLFSE